MGKIGVIQSNNEEKDASFQIDKYFFYRKCSDEYKKEVLEHFISIKWESGISYDYVDLINILKDIDQTPIEVVSGEENEKKIVRIKWLTDVPKEIHEYINEFELEIEENEETIFYDFRKRYIEICKCENLEVEIDIAIIGFTLINNRFEIKIKAFNYETLEKISNKIKEHFMSLREEFNFIIDSADLRWLKVKDHIISSRSRFISEDSTKLLKTTLKAKWNNLFEYIFSNIDRYGYIDLSLRENEDEENKLRRRIQSKKQFNSLFKPYLKLSINNHFLYIHNDPSINLKEEFSNRVFTLPPRLMQYYEMEWFEEYVGEILNQIRSDDFEIIDKLPSKIFNFYGDSLPERNIEIDWIIRVNFKGQSSIIGIECKKTLKKTYYSNTKTKIKEKIIKSNNNVIDGYILVGFFSEHGFNNSYEINDRDYKPEYLFNESDSSDIFIQYMATKGSDCNELKEKLTSCIDLICKDNSSA